MATVRRRSVVNSAIAGVLLVMGALKNECATQLAASASSSLHARTGQVPSGNLGLLATVSEPPYGLIGSVAAPTLSSRRRYGSTATLLAPRCGATLHSSSDAAPADSAGKLTSICTRTPQPPMSAGPAQCALKPSLATRLPPRNPVLRPKRKHSQRAQSMTVELNQHAADVPLITPTQPPSHARIVIIGGGIMGCSVAYHLSALGVDHIVLLEQGRLTCGTTWHAAGLVGQLRAQESMTRLIRYSTELYARLEAETGLATGWKQCGSLAVARTRERMIQLRRTAAVALAYGVECDLITPAEAAARDPTMATDDLHGAVWLPGDGKANPTDLTLALAKVARQRGVTIMEGT